MKYKSFKRKDVMSIFQFVVLVMLFLCFVLPGIVWGQEQIFVQAPLNELQIMPNSCLFEPGSQVAIWSLSSAEEEKGTGARDADLRAGRGQIAREWCLANNLKVVAEYHVQGKSGERGVRIIAGKNLEFILKQFMLLAQEDQKLSVKTDSILQSQISWLARQAVYGWELAVGTEYVLIERNEFCVPSLALTWNAGLTGFQGKVGGLPENQKTLNGIWGGSFFIRPYKHLKIHVGYEGASCFYEKDFTWINRYDCFLTGVEIESPEWKRMKGHVSFNALKAEKWGMSVNFSLSFKL